VKSARFRFDKEKKELPVVYIQEPASKAPIPIPIPDITPLSPPLGSCRRCRRRSRSSRTRRS
jgi:hypothetical protein